MNKRLFGKLSTGEEIYSYTMKDSNNEIEIITFGGSIVRFVTFGIDIIGGFDTMEDYETDTSHQGALVGRVANRIEGGTFTMDGVTYDLPKNNHGNCLHGGVGFDRKVWKEIGYTDTSLTLAYTSFDGEEGFPSELYVEVTYSLEKGALVIDYKATPKGKTPIALTNHAYFNLDGFGGDVKGHVAKVYAKQYTAVNEILIPTGERPSVMGTVFDLTEEKALGDCVSEDFVGYDHNFILSPEIFEEYAGKKVGLACELKGKSLKMYTYTDQPGIQIYMGNFLGPGPDFKGGVKKIRHGAVCLEAQTEPNCVKHGEAFYSAGEVYTQTTVYKVEELK